VLVLRLIGEWYQANLMMGGAFVVAAVGVGVLGWWVLRGDSINRRQEAPGAEEEPAPDPAVGGQQAQQASHE
jgi:hypothetical protein